MGYLLLEGGAEFGGQMAAPDKAAMACAGGVDAPIRILPAAAAPDNNHHRAGGNGERWFRSLGARDVLSLPIIDRASADDAQNVSAVETAKLIYLLGGFTDYLGQTLRQSQTLQAMHRAYANGAVLAGSSAGAMVLCEFYYDPERQRIQPGLNFVPNTCVLPHHNTFGKNWATRLTKLLPQARLVGIDEQTGMWTDDGAHWRVAGRGGVTLYAGGVSQFYTTELRL